MGEEKNSLVEEKILQIEGAIKCADEENIFDRIVPSAQPGLIMEFGVYEGATLRSIARASPERLVYGFDSFEGLPEDWEAEEKAGAFNTDPPSGLPQNVRLIIGSFRETVPWFMQNQSSGVAFAHIDCDLYSSTKYVLDGIGGHLAEGAILMFDEIVGYRGYRNHEIRAFAEFLIETGYSFETIGRRHPRSVAVRILK